MMKDCEVFGCFGFVFICFECFGVCECVVIALDGIGCVV